MFPNICNGCKSLLLQNEKILCAQCIHNLPIACHHRTKNQAMKNIFYGKFPIENATAIIKFQKKGSSQEILHQLKYRGQKAISSFFGAWLGAELVEIQEYRDIDLIIPVPLHRLKLKIRGYNQVEGFGKEIAKALKKPYCDNILLKISRTDSQVFKKRFSRLRNSGNTEEIFSINNPNFLKDKHVLLVDDIITTGSTLENCAIQLLKENTTKLSIATIAIA